MGNAIDKVIPGLYVGGFLGTFKQHRSNLKGSNNSTVNSVVL